jgi:LMBR1 domain-containing protein 1
MKAISCPITEIQLETDTVKFAKCNSRQDVIKIDVSLPIFTIGMLSFISWFIFVIFAGVGLPALPIDLIYEFIKKPKKMSKDNLHSEKIQISTFSDSLHELANTARDMEETGVKKLSFLNSQKRKYNTIIKKLNVGVLALEKWFNDFKIQSELTDSWVLAYYFKLILGILFLFISLAWIVHILLYFVIRIDGQPADLFINRLLSILQGNNLGFIGLAIYASLSLYLLLATVKGNLKFGLRIFIVDIHPMVKGETFMNSILFNISLILISSISVTQFCSQAFSEYALMTDIDLIFSNQIRYLVFFRFFINYRIFEYSLFVIFYLI